MLVAENNKTEKVGADLMRLVLIASQMNESVDKMFLLVKFDEAFSFTPSTLNAIMNRRIVLFVRCSTTKQNQRMLSVAIKHRLHKCFDCLVQIIVVSHSIRMRLVKMRIQVAF